ncbi:MAG TPA: hypothetical protein DDW52_07665, partial [Planctomycetaceae bacterium]|nr:hypothetical protein [Planctomycetaceae bacterium]
VVDEATSPMHQLRIQAGRESGRYQQTRGNVMGMIGDNRSTIGAAIFLPKGALDSLHTLAPGTGGTG